MEDLQIISVFLLVTTGVLTLALVVIFNQKKATSQKLQLLKGMTDYQVSISKWSSLSVLEKMSFKTIESFSFEIETYYHQIVNDWDVLRLGTYLSKLESSSMKSECKALLQGWIEAAIKKLTIKALAGMFVNIIHDNIDDENSITRNYRNKLKDTIIKVIYLRGNGNSDYTHFAKALEIAITNSEVTSVTLATLLKAELIQFRQSTRT